MILTVFQYESGAIQLELYEESPIANGYPKEEMNESIWFQSISLILSIMTTVISGYLMLCIGFRKIKKDSDDKDPVTISTSRARQ